MPITRSETERGMDLRTRCFGVGFVAVGLMVAVAGCATTASQPERTVALAADYPSYGSVDSLGKGADLIVEVSVGQAKDGVMLPDYSSDDPQINPYAGSEETPQPNEGALPITVYSATVEAVHQGDATVGDVIEVKQAGGVLDGVRYELEGVAPLKEGATMLLFLETYPDSPASILGGDVGAFLAVGDRFVSLGGTEFAISTTELEAKFP